jgi:hypothetical protein
VAEQVSKALPGEQDLEAKYKHCSGLPAISGFRPPVSVKYLAVVGQGKQVYLTLDRSE